MQTTTSPQITIKAATDFAGRAMRHFVYNGQVIGALGPGAPISADALLAQIDMDALAQATNPVDARREFSTAVDALRPGPICRHCGMRTRRGTCTECR